MITLTDETFQQEVLESDIPVLVDFWATWCGPCKMLSPIMEQIENEYRGVIKISKANVEEVSKPVLDYNISGVPAIVIFNNGKMLSKQIGLRTKEKIDIEIKKVL